VREPSNTGPVREPVLKNIYIYITRMSWDSLLPVGPVREHNRQCGWCLDDSEAAFSLPTAYHAVSCPWSIISAAPTKV